MPRLSDLQPLDEFNPETAQVLLGDNPKFRREQAEMVARVKQCISESGDPTMISRLPELDRAHEAYEADPAWVSGPGFVQLLEVLRPMLQFLTVVD